MIAKMILFSHNKDDINNFLSKFYNTNLGLENTLSWHKDFSNPVDISEIIAALVDNNNSFNIIMWISLDEDVFINITPSNAEIIIRYLFERYPY